jgi:hypothetical protein
MLIFKEIRLKGKIVDKANRGIFISYKSDNNFLVYFLSNNKIISTKNQIKEKLNYKEDYLKEVLKENYFSLLEYLKAENFNNNKIDQPKIIDLKDLYKDLYKDSDKELINKENTIIVKVPKSTKTTTRAITRA